jgi:hypothetical protein
VARPRTRRRPPLLSIATHTTHATLVPVRGGDKTNASPVAPELQLLPPLARRGRVVTAAALPPQTALAPLMLDHGGPYLCTVQDNQPRLPAERAAYCAAPQATGRTAPTVDRRRGRTAPTVDRRRGRTATRTLSARTRLNASVQTYFPFPPSAQGARLIRTVDTTGQTTTQTV